MDGSITYINGEGLTVTSLGAMHLSDGTGASIIRQYAEPGLGSRLTIGLDETATMVICKASNVDSDFALANTYGHPRLVMMSTAGNNSYRFALTQTHYLSRIDASGRVSRGELQLYAGGSIVSSFGVDRASGDFFNLNSAADIELTDADGEQSMLYVEPKINQSSTAAYNGIKVNVLETTPGTSIGDGSTGDGNNLLNLQRESVTHFKVDRTGAYGTMGSTGGLMTYYSEATANITAAHTVTIQTNIPSGAKIIGCQLRVDAALADGETWNAQYVTGATQTIASAQAVAQNTKINTFFNVNTATDIASDEVDITIQRSSNPGVDTFTAQGTIRAIVYYQTFTAMGNAS
jgi:hypothetical protein